MERGAKGRRGSMLLLNKTLLRMAKGLWRWIFLITGLKLAVLVGLAAFARIIPGTTKIIIAQRISSIQDADLILVLDGGAINGMGTHETLLSSNQIYQEVYYSQNRTGGADNG